MKENFSIENPLEKVEEEVKELEEKETTGLVHLHHKAGMSLVGKLANYLHFHRLRAPC